MKRVIGPATWALAPAFLVGAAPACLVAALAAGCSADAAGPGADTQPTAPDEAGLTPLELLGKRMFEDTTLSEPAGQACASCHAPSAAFTGNDGSSIAAVARGAQTGMFGSRNVPTVMYASFSPPFSFVDGEDGPTPTGGQFWDGRAATLADQALGPFLNPREMANSSGSDVVAKIAAGPHAGLYEQVFGSFDDSAYANVGAAIAAFEQTSRFHPFSSKFDAVLRGEAQLSALEQRGFELFQDPEKGNCIACHAGNVESREPRDWLFTDFTYDNLGVPRNAAIPDNADPAHFDLGLCAREQLVVPEGVDRASLCGAFKVPTLRNIELTAPYGHNGRFETLRDVVRFYVTRDVTPELWYPDRPYDDVPPIYVTNVNRDEVPYEREAGQPPRLDDDEIDAVVAFLMTLTDR